MLGNRRYWCINIMITTKIKGKEEEEKIFNDSENYWKKI